MELLEYSTLKRSEHSECGEVDAYPSPLRLGPDLFVDEDSGSELDHQEEVVASAPNETTQPKSGLCGFLMAARLPLLCSSHLP